MSTIATPSRSVTASALAGGASLGAMQAGMVRALNEPITADLVVRTSAGALDAAHIVWRAQTVETTKQLAGVWRGLHREDSFPIHPPTLIGGLSLIGAVLALARTAVHELRLPEPIGA